MATKILPNVNLDSLLRAQKQRMENLSKVSARTTNAMSLFISDKSSILQELRWLQPLSNPPGGRPLCRDADLKLIARYLADLFTTGQARNLFIYGRPGTGKTICVKYVLDEVAKQAVEAKLPIQTAYVNAGKTRNPYYTMAEVLKQLGVTVPSAG